MSGQAPEVGGETFVEAWRRGVRVIDVRSAEFADGHVPGAVNVPLDEVLASPQRFMGAEWHVLCQSGGRSLTAAEAMNAAGAWAVSVSGGTSAWIGAGHEIERGVQR